MTLYVADDRSLVQILRRDGNACCHIDDIASEWDRSSTIVAVGASGKVIVRDLMSRGIKSAMLRYADGDLNHHKHFDWDDAVALSELPDDDDFPVYSTGLGFLDKNLGWGWRLPELCVTAGAYASGKSTLGQILAGEFVCGSGREVGSGALLCSWEDLASEVKRNFRLLGKTRGVPDIWDRVHFVRRPPDADRLISWYMELVERYVETFNTRYFFLDPWNEMDHQKNASQSETDYVRDMMKSFRRLVDKLKVILNIATHVPARLIKGDGSIEPFKIAHSFGSVQFANKADRGICVLRAKRITDPDDPERILEHPGGYCIIRLDKSKVERKMGKKGTVVCRLNTDNFSLEYDAEATRCLQGVWSD